MSPFLLRGDLSKDQAFYVESTGLEMTLFLYSYGEGSID
jgi:hypothetical protein